MNDSMYCPIQEKTSANLDRIGKSCAKKAYIVQKENKSDKNISL